MSSEHILTSFSAGDMIDTEDQAEEYAKSLLRVAGFVRETCLFYIVESEFYKYITWK